MTDRTHNVTPLPCLSRRVLGLIVGSTTFLLVAGVILAFPPHTDTDTENMIVMTRLLLEGKTIPIEGMTVAQALPAVLNYIAYECLGGIRGVQLVAVGAFSIAMGMTVVSVEMLAGRLAALLLWVGMLTSYPLVRAVTWARSPAWAFAMLAFGVFFFLHLSRNHEVNAQQRGIPERAIHVGLLFSLFATLCRSDVIAMHAVLLGIAGLYAAVQRRWKMLLHLTPWVLVLSVPVLEGLLFYRDPLSVVHLGEYYMDMRKHLDPLTGASMQHSVLDKLRKGMQDRETILFPASVVFGWLGFISLYRHRRHVAVVTGAVLASTFAACAITSWFGVVSARQFLVPRVLTLFFAAVGLQAVFAWLPNARLGRAAAILFVVGMLIAHRDRYTSRLEGIRNHADLYNRHAEMANAIAHHPSLRDDTPIVVQHDYCSFVFRNRLHRDHLSVLAEYEFTYRYLAGKPLPEQWTYVRGTTNTLFSKANPALVPDGDVLLELNGLTWMTAH